MADTAQSFGIGFAQKYPALSAKLAGVTAQKTGLDPADPANLAAAMHSNVFQTEAGKASQATDPAVIDRVFAPQKFAPDNASVETQTKTAFDVKQSNIESGMAAKRQLFGQSQEAASQLAELSNFNREDYTAARLRTLDPVKDLDQRALELRMQAFTAQSMLETDPEIMALPPALQERAMASKMQVFSDAIQTIAKVREARLTAAKDQIGKEIGAREQQINVSKYRVDSIDAQIKQLNDIGGDQDTIASLRLDRIKEMDRLAKARAKGGGIVTQKEYVYDALNKDFESTHGRIATDQEQQEMKRRTEMIVKNDPATVAAVTTAAKSPLSLYPGLQRLADSTGQSAGAVAKLHLKSYSVPLSEAEQIALDKADADVARTRQLTEAGAQ